MAALVMLIPLALTSNAWSIRRLGPRWTKLHRLIYPIAAAGALHYCLSVKVIGPEEMAYAGAIAVLIGWRLARPRFLRWKRGRRQAEPGFAASRVQTE
jgi:sulfoxide reductase heme-binding subunit YedZ